MADVISERGKKKLVYNRYIFWRDGQSSPQSNKQNVINATPNHMEIYRSFEEIAEHKQKQD